jgi:hypothetical protein
MDRWVLLERRSLSALVLTLLCASVVFAGVKVINPESKWPVFILSPPAHIYVLAIGLDVDRSVPNFRPSFHGSKADAEALSAEFKSNFAYSDVSVTVLANQEATRSAILAAIQKIALSSKSEDMFVFSFSGFAFTKGGTEPAAENSLLPTGSKNPGELYLVPYDADVPETCKNIACIGESSLISGTLLYSWMTQLHAQRQILLFDTNYTDAALPLIEQRWKREACNVGTFAEKRILLLTTHGLGSEVHLKNGRFSGAITHAFLNVMSALRGGDFVTAAQIQQDLYTKYFGSDLFPPQSPDEIGEQAGRAELLGGDFVINSSRATERFAKPEMLRLSSGLGPLCYNPPEDAGLRGFPTNKKQDANQPPPLPQPVNHALLIAMSDYKNWQHLPNPVSDAETIESDLKSRFGFQIEHLWNPSREQLNTKLHALHEEQFGDKDQLFIFIAGHGDYDEENDIGYLVFPETPAGHSYEKEMNLQELRQKINSLPVKHILLVMDSCFAGNLDPTLGGGLRGSPYDPIPLPALIKRSEDKKTRYFLTSGSKEYVSDGLPGHHSPFAALFILALEKASAPGQYLNLSQMPHYFERLATTPRAGNLGSNEEGADFFFVPTAEPGVGGPDSPWLR